MDPTSRDWLKLEPSSTYLPLSVGDVLLKARSQIVHGLERAPEALRLLFRGQNDGKLMIEVSAPP